MAFTSFSAFWLVACCICMASFIFSSWLMAAIFAFTCLAYSGSLLRTLEVDDAAGLRGRGLRVGAGLLAQILDEGALILELLAQGGDFRAREPGGCRGGRGRRGRYARVQGLKGLLGGGGAREHQAGREGDELQHEQDSRRFRRARSMGRAIGPRK